MTINLNFCFKGDRDYIQGTSVVSELFQTMANKKLSQIDLKFNGIIQSGLDLVEGAENPEAKVNIRWLESDDTKIYQLVENGKSIDCRKEYNEDSIIDKTTLNLNSQSILLDEVTNYTLCENFVAMNKFLLQRIYPQEKGKWFFTRLEQTEFIPDNCLIKVKLIKNFNFRLTKSDILVDGKVIGSVYFTMVREG
jgi:hypothetical protein